MKKFAFIIIAVLLLVSCSLYEEEKATQSKPLPESTLNEKELVHFANMFGMDVFSVLHDEEPDENMLISPMSISIALGMTLNGAENETYDAIRQTLALSTEEESINPQYQALIEYLINLDPDVIMSIANSIWYKEGLPVYDEFITTNQTYFNAEVAELDFGDPNSVDIINNWVNDATNGVIEDILDEIPSEMVMYLINALYFKGGWRFPFDVDVTSEQPFNNLDGTVSTLPMMGQEITVAHYVDWDENLYIADLPFGDSLYSFTLIVPDDIVSFSDSLTFDKWEYYMDNLRSGEVYVGLPRFDLEWEKSLNEILKSLGMEVAFSESEADFSRIMPLGYGNLYISEVKHKTNLSVDEEGAVGAAVTSVGIGVTSAPPAVIANKPFILAIRENQLGTIMFLGKVVKL